MELTTTAVPRHRQASHWQSVINEVFVPLEFRPHTGDRAFAARLAVHRVDGLEVSHLHADPHAVVRSPDAGSGEATIFAMVPISGRLLVEQDGRSARLGTGDLAVYDASRPCSIESRDRFDLTVFKIPAGGFREAGFPEPPAGATAVRIEGASPLGSLVVPFLVRLAELGRTVERLGVRASALGLLSTALGDAGHDERGGRQALRLRAEALMREGLGDARLDPTRIAATLHVSVRTLQMAFTEVDLSPARHLLALRLDRAAALLTGPGEGARTITEIAFAVGFTDSSAFSRAFRARHGCAPRDFRLRESTIPAARSVM